MLNSPFGISSKFRFSFSTRYFIIDFPIGWPEFFSTIANVFKNSFLLDLSHIKISTTSGVPLVIVPVLSKQIVVTLANSSMTTPPFIKTPFFAALPTLATTAVGVASINAQGHAITKIDITRIISFVSRAVIAQIKRIVGRKNSANLSAVF